jgi:hypothetical protein
MIKFIMAILLTFFSSQILAQNGNNNRDNLSAQCQSGVTYRIYPTQNVWTFIKLNTRNGQMWQVQFNMSRDKRFVSNLSSQTLVSSENEINDRFALFPTQNIYTFILLDQVDGKTWQVQWSIDQNDRGIMSIE